MRKSQHRLHIPSLTSALLLLACVLDIDAIGVVQLVQNERLRAQCISQTDCMHSVVPFVSYQTERLTSRVVPFNASLGPAPVAKLIVNHRRGAIMDRKLLDVQPPQSPAVASQFPPPAPLLPTSINGIVDTIKSFFNPTNIIATVAAVTGFVVMLSTCCLLCKSCKKSVATVAHAPDGASAQPGQPGEPKVVFLTASPTGGYYAAMVPGHPVLAAPAPLPPFSAGPPAFTGVPQTHVLVGGMQQQQQQQQAMAARGGPQQQARQTGQPSPKQLLESAAQLGRSVVQQGMQVAGQRAPGRPRQQAWM
ncbi:hypothetical protein QJQ45_017201 [Haematococcus lacustris]|nr:hypothetical protein QJQ45_017201 [Haematococcus lacustris]